MSTVVLLNYGARLEMIWDHLPVGVGPSLHICMGFCYMFSLNISVIFIRFTLLVKVWDICAHSKPFFICTIFYFLSAIMKKLMLRNNMEIDSKHKFLKVFTHPWYVLNQLHESALAKQAFS